MTDPKPADLFARNRDWHRALRAMRDPVLADVGSALAAYSDYGLRDEMWPAASKLAEETGVERRTVIRKLAALVDLGFITATENRHPMGVVGYVACDPPAAEDLATLREKAAALRNAGGTARYQKWRAKQANAQVSVATADALQRPDHARCNDEIIGVGRDTTSIRDPIRTRSEDSATVASAPAAPPRETPKQGSLLPEPTSSPTAPLTASRGGSASPPASKPKKAKPEHTDTHKFRLAWEADFKTRYGVEYLGWHGGAGKAISHRLAHVSLAELVALIPKFHADYPAKVQGTRRIFDFVDALDTLRSKFPGVRPSGASDPETVGLPSPPVQMPVDTITLARLDKQLRAINPAWGARQRGQWWIEICHNGQGRYLAIDPEMREYETNIGRGKTYTFPEFVAAVEDYEVRPVPEAA